MQKCSDVKKDWLYAAKLIKVIDGDTLSIVISAEWDRREKVSVRLNGINTPELNSADTDDRRVAQEAKAELERMLTEYTTKHGKWFVVRTFRKDKYGRPLADVILPYSQHGDDPDCDCGKELLKAGLAKAYKD